MRSARLHLAVMTMAVISGLPSFAPAAAAAGPAAVTEVRTQKAASDALEKGLPGAAGRLVIVSPHDYLSGMLLPLRRAGVLKELVAVLPFDNALSAAHMEGVQAFLDKAGVSAGDRKSLVLDNGCVAGTIEGMPVKLCTLTTLSRQDGRSLLALDTAFLPAIYRNEVKTPMVDLAWKLVLTLRDRRVTTDGAVLFDATARPDFSLAFGYLSSLLREMLSERERFSASLPEKWVVLKAAEAAFFFSQYAEAMTLYREYLEKSPGDASACFKIAMLAARDLDVEMTVQWLNKAADADRLYKRAYPEIAGYLLGKELYEGAERILLAGLSKFPKDPGLATSLAGLYLSRGDAMRESGSFDAAREAYDAASAVDGAEASMRERARSLTKSLPPAPAE